MEQFEQEERVRLVIQYLDGKSSENEIDSLKNWIASSDSHKLFYQRVKNIWDITVNKQNLSEISADKALNKVLSQLSVKKQKHSLFYYWQRIAAIILIPVLIGSFVWIRSLIAENTSSITYNEVYAAFGTRSAIKLSDGSLVWLNSGSKLRYPDKFINKQREVYLTGEAYFEVKSDKTHPFIVKTSFLDVKATGTKFNVSVYNKEKQLNITLLEGKVFVTDIKEGKEKGEASVYELIPNQNMIFDTLSHDVNVIENVDLYKYISWKDGKLIFRNEPLSEVIRKISLYYNVDIEIQGNELSEYRYRATFKEESLSEILKLLKLSSPIDYKEIVRKPLNDGTFQKRKVIIFPANESISKK